jgi:hypothetical protein
MTAQEPDVLKYEGKTVEIFSTPLEQCFSKQNPRPQFQMTKTSNWRGYVATWEITNQKLYLINLDGTIKGGGHADMQMVFPNAIDKVFAEWFSSDIRIPDGEKLKYVHMGFESVYERDIILSFKKGALVKKKVVDNKDRKKSKPFDPLDPLPPPPRPPMP